MLPLTCYNKTMEGIGKYFIEHGGLLGAVIVVLAGVIAYLARKLDQKETMINTIQTEWRNSETERADKLIQALNTNSAVQAALVDKIEIGRGKR